MKITIYTIADCQFSKQEKEYLTSHSLQYEEKNLETNKDFLTEMLAVSNNFAGTPVTRVEKDDGLIAVLKGFTKEEFDTTFGFAASPTNNQSPATASNQPPVNDTPTSPAEVLTKAGPTDSTVLTDSTVSPAPVPIDLPPVEAPTTPDLSADSSSKVSTTEEASAKADPLKSVMDDLQSKSEPTMPPAEQPPITPLITNDQPTTTSPTDSPSIPDFPAADAKTTV